MFFTGWPHVFDLCAKTFCARRNPKTNVSSTMNYLSSDMTLISVVLVVLQITAWENWSNSKKVCSSLIATSWLLVSAQATWRRLRGWLIVYRWSFFLSLFICFIPELISAVTSPIAEICLPTHVSWLRVVNVCLEFSKILLTYFTECKKTLKCIFSRVFHRMTSRFRSLRKNGLC